MGNCNGTKKKNSPKNSKVSERRSKPNSLTAAVSLSHSIITTDINRDYCLDKVLGKGRFGIVRKAYSKVDPELCVAVKSIFKNSVGNDIEMLKREIDMLSTMDHPNIIKWYDTYEDSKFVHLVMEYCSGGELFDRIIKKGYYSENEAAKLVYKIIWVLSHLHMKGIVHRDIKPENFMFEDSKEEAELKLIDFGLSGKFGNKLVRSKSIMGTPFYIAPEALYGEYSFPGDMWSVGVLAYIVLSGKLPFPGQNNQEVYDNILKGEFNMTGTRWENIEDQAKDLIRKLLVIDPAGRLTAERALAHPWFNKPRSNRRIKVDKKILESLRDYRARSKLQQEAYAVLVKYLSCDELNELRQAFTALDITNSGTLTLMEIDQALADHGFDVAKEEILEILQHADYKKDGQINYSEFLAATFSSKILVNEGMIWEVFKRFDTDRSGYITVDKLKEVLRRLGKAVTDEEVQDMIAEVDLDRDGKISFEEFEKVFKPEQAPKKLADSFMAPSFIS
jgi:calcium-dependent protein kinase